MKLFRSSRSLEKEKPLPARFVEKDGDVDSGSEFEYDDETKKALEMENMLGNALSITERDKGSIIRLQRSGTFEMGRQFASRNEDASISDAHFPNHDDASYISRTSSFQSAASLPTFVKVEQGNPAILTQRSWEMIMDNSHDQDDPETQHHDQGQSVPSTTDAASKPIVLAPKRSWSKLRQEIDEEENARFDENRDVSRTVSLGKLGFGFRKKASKDTKEEIPKDVTLSKKSSKRSSGTGKSRAMGIFRNGKKTDASEELHYAKDYDVEVSLQEKKKSLWKRYSSLKKDSGKQNSKDKNANNSFDTPKSTDATEELSDTPPRVDDSIVEQKQKVIVQMHSVDVMMESLELVCCGDNGETLDNITDMLPPYV